MIEAKDGCRCTGHCCEDFSLPFPPEELNAGYHRWVSREGAPMGMNGHSLGPWYKDIWLIAPMVVYLGYKEGMPPRVNPSDEELKGEPELKYHRYKCKHFDPQTRDCTIYDIRPAMCRSYPGPSGCNYADCTWESRKVKKETPEETEARRKRLNARAEDLEKVEKAPEG